MAACGRREAYLDYDKLLAPRDSVMDSVLGVHLPDSGFQPRTTPLDWIRSPASTSHVNHQ